MVDTLRKYREKRNFDVTSEPAGGGKANAAARAFVIQKHWATRLHYDLRLELDGAMKSWAVPKGPCYDPSVKRMAVQVEDHPIAYNQFEGEIPAGQYGAGKVIIWDEGTWTPVGDPRKGYREGHLKFDVEGVKMRGRWALVRLKGRESERQPPWLLIKDRDEFARPEREFSVVDEMPDSVVPLRAQRRKAAAAAAKSARSAQSAKAGAKSAEDAKAGARSAKSAKPGARSAEGAAGEETPAQSAAQASGHGALPGTAATLPATLKPQLATLVDGIPPRPEEWLFEVKFDGYRLLARLEEGAVRLYTRNGHDWTARMPHLRDALARLDVQDAWIDGEITVLADNGAPSFQALQNAFDNERTGDIVFYAFDLPYVAGRDLRHEPVTVRRALLEQLLARAPDPRLRFSEAFDAPPAGLVASACKMGLEGIIAKRRTAPYVSRRSDTWLKIKCAQRQEFVIAGYTDPKGSRSGLGALLVAVHDAAGNLQYAGKVGTGFDSRLLDDLARRLKPLEVDERPVAYKAGIPRNVHWVKPTLLAEISFGEWTESGHIRHAVFRGLRADKPARAITREAAVPAQAIETDDEEMPDGKAPRETAAGAEPGKRSGKAKRANARGGRQAAAEAEADAQAESATAEDMEASKAAKPSKATKASKVTKTAKAAKVADADTDDPGQGAPRRGPAPKGRLGRLTNPERVIDPSTGLTKLDLARYYGLVAPLLLEHLKGRPVSLVRAPGGIQEPLFFQKHLEAAMPGVKSLPQRLDPDHPSLLEVPSDDAIISAAQMNVVEFHTWNAVKTAIDRPDRMLFDLDPGEGVQWASLVQGAELVRVLLDQIGLECWLKTSGGKGLHVVVPLRKQYGWDTIKAFSEAIVRHLARTLPQLFVAKSGPKNRVGRIFADYLRNGFGATTVAAWSARARPGLGISVPIAWDELHTIKSGAHWTIESAHDRLDVGNSPWDDYRPQAVKRAMAAIGFEPEEP
jgi:bifunctional non-homologous end joining protein LigD